MNQNKEKLNSRDLITTGIFSVLFAAVVFIGSLTMGFTPFTYPFLIAVVMVPGGIIWEYLRVKVPKRWGILIQFVILAILLTIMGSGWWIALGSLIGGGVAEWIASRGNYTNFKINTVAYCVMGVIFNLGSFAPVFLAAEYYYRYCIENGMDAGYMDIFMAFMGWPILAIATVLTVLGAFAGAMLGRFLMKKHFVKAGIA